jgi:hypothetical protein
VLVPGVLALLPEYAGLTDPVAELRAACLEAVAWLGEEGPVQVLADPQGERVARALLDACGGFETGAERLPQPPGDSAERLPQPPGDSAERLPRPAGDSAERLPRPPTLLVGSGSACRTEKAPGFLDERAAAFDDALRAALLSGDVSAVDLGLGRELLASLDGIGRLGEVVTPGAEVSVDYDDAPFGVQYWVMRWES